jgi:hypothetical protein
MDGCGLTEVGWRLRLKWKKEIEEMCLYGGELSGIGLGIDRA